MNDYTEIIKSVQALTNDCLPPLDISEILYNHKCYYLLSKKIQSNKYTEKAQMANNIQLIQTVQRYKTCAAFFCFLNENNIKYAVIKGAVLSNAAYGTICVRQSCDIDILIESKNLDIIKSFMQKNNFIQGRIVGNNIFPLSREEIMFQTLMTHQTAPYIKKTSNVFCPFVNVDINTDIVWGESQLHPNISNVLSQTTDVKIHPTIFFDGIGCACRQTQIRIIDAVFVFFVSNFHNPFPFKFRFSLVSQEKQSQKEYVRPPFCKSVMNTQTKKSPTGTCLSDFFVALQHPKLYEVICKSRTRIGCGFYQTYIKRIIYRSIC